MSNTQFCPPYGKDDQHVTDKALHNGYVFLVAYLVEQGYAASYIAVVCQQAAEEGAPLDAVRRRHLHPNQWMVVTDYSEDDPQVRVWRQYVQALEAFEESQRRFQVWATTDDPNWIKRNTTRDVRMLHNAPKREAEELASRIRLLAPTSVVTVKAL